MSPRFTPLASFSCFSSLGFCLPTSGSYTFTSSFVAERGWERSGAPSSWYATGCSKDGSSTIRSRCDVPSFFRFSSRMRSMARNASLSSQSARASSDLWESQRGSVGGMLEPGLWRRLFKFSKGVWSPTAPNFVTSSKERSRFPPCVDPISVHAP
jgi:hypothetical protein